MLLPRFSIFLKRHWSLWLVLIALTFCLAVETPAQTTTELAAHTLSVSGRITLGGQPLAGIVVTARKRGPDSLRVAQTMAKATTDRDGRYRLIGLSAGNFYVMPQADQYLVTNLERTGSRNEPGLQLTLLPGETRNRIDFTLERGGVITGRVTDAAGTPVAGQRIKLLLLEEERPRLDEPPVRRVRKTTPPPTITSSVPPGIPDRIPPGVQSTASRLNTRSWEGSSYATTDDRGIYRCYRLPAGRYVVGIVQSDAWSLALDQTFENVTRWGRDGNRTAYYPDRFYPAATNADEAGLVAVGPGGEVAGIDIKLVQVEYPVLYTIRGRLAGSTDAGLADVQVIASRVDEIDESEPHSQYQYRKTQSDVNGGFILSGLIPGHYRIRVDVRNQNNTLYDPVEVELKDRDIENLALTAKPGLIVSGRLVVENLSDRPLPFRLDELRIWIFSQGSDLHASSSDNAPINPDGTFTAVGFRPGRFNFALLSRIAGLQLRAVESGGRLMINAINSGSYPGPSSFVLDVGQSATTVILRAVYSSMRVRVQIKRDGDPWPPGTDFSLSYQQGPGGRGTGRRLDDAGNFEIEGLAPGTCELDARVVVPNGGRGKAYFARTTVTIDDKPDNTLNILVESREP